jgi:hypothetical protein
MTFRRKKTSARDVKNASTRDYASVVIPSYSYQRIVKTKKTKKQKTNATPVIMKLMNPHQKLYKIKFSTFYMILAFQLISEKIEMLFQLIAR